MKIEEHKAKVFKKMCTLKLMHYEDIDRKNWKKLFDLWKKLHSGLEVFHGRKPNLPEALSESAFCFYSSSKQLISLKGSASSSFDTFNLIKGKAEQIKATSVKKDLTSFGPTSVWDDLYFLDFYNNGKLDGIFDIYKIPDKYVYYAKVNKNTTLQEQQKKKLRPRLCIKKILIETKLIKPLKKNYKIW